MNLHNHWANIKYPYGIRHSQYVHLSWVWVLRRFKFNIVKIGREGEMLMEGKISIEGILLMLDDATPHVAVPVEALRGGTVIARTLSDEGGEYRLINLKQGRYQVRCQVLGGYVYYEKGGNGRKWKHE